MKKIYLIQFNSTENQILESRIKGLGTWVKYFDDNWLVTSDLSANDIYLKITEGLENQSLIIMEIPAKNYYGRMNTKVWEFLKANKSK